MRGALCGEFTSFKKDMDTMKEARKCWRSSQAVETSVSSHIGTCRNQPVKPSDKSLNQLGKQFFEVITAEFVKAGVKQVVKWLVK